MGQRPIRRAEGIFQLCRVAKRRVLAVREYRLQDRSISGEYCGAFVEERSNAFTVISGVAHSPLNDTVPGELLCKIRLECMPAAFADFGQGPRWTGCKVSRQPDGRVLDLLFCDDPVHETPVK